MTSNGFACPNEESFINKVHPAPAHRAGSLGFDTMIKGANAQMGMADKACASKANRDALARAPP
ncbi:MAG: hypothetical protein GDA36_01285 [Rhodobacteraceae bacterium]|nr:hypothetical protein [Paracoccaceae bacterium]